MQVQCLQHHQRERSYTFSGAPLPMLDYGSTRLDLSGAALDRDPGALREGSAGTEDDTKIWKSSIGS